MAAGISTERKHQIEYRLLKGLQRDLARQGIQSSYASLCLSGTHEGQDWHIAYDSVARQQRRVLRDAARCRGGQVPHPPPRCRCGQDPCRTLERTGVNYAHHSHQAPCPRRQRRPGLDMVPGTRRHCRWKSIDICTAGQSWTTPLHDAEGQLIRRRKSHWNKRLP